jgi:hypothetical protein
MRRKPMRTRRSPSNQDRLFRQLGTPSKAEFALIQAGPALLSSLSEIFWYVDRNGYRSYTEAVESVVVNIPSAILRTARAAIAKAEGRTEPCNAKTG